ncbi:hypothetical protein MYAM1_000743 [Malassezia yamatoensis]|uniref:GYF domain-containing protein n=1 Tax=Malassezia yamatoensis TaxID=253288 RepID=A0AAJ6CF75_9BASI|nr:hypothetical protein MYAM1_000743 [Malassezia yamatoensis]
MSDTKRKVPWPESESSRKRAYHEEDADGDYDLDVEGNKQSRTRPGGVVTEGFDSEDEEEDEETHKRHWNDKADNEEDDMFAEDASKASTSKKEPRFLKLSEIEGQEFGSTTQLDDEDNVEEVGELDPEYELQRALQDTRYQNANEDAEKTPPGSDDEDHPRQTKKGMGFRMEKFNMKEEMASGRFDEEGNYIQNQKDPFSRSDQWLEGNYSKKQILAAQQAQAKRQQDAVDRAKADETEFPSAEHAMRSLAQLLKPGESVLDALQRIGARAKRKGGDSASLEKITHLTTLLMSTFGHIDIYDAVYETLVRTVRRANLVSEDWDPSRETVEAEKEKQWEYRWAASAETQTQQASESSQKEKSPSFGPYSAHALREWAAQGYFGPDQSHILLRNPGDSTWISWTDSGRARYLVGKDLADNAYYEFPSASGSTDPRHTRRVIKWKVSKHQSEYNPKDVPIQWDAWMRHTRQQPPSIQDLVDDLERQRIVLHNARVLQSREEAAQFQMEAERQQEHRQAITEQQAREKSRLEQMQTAAANADPELVAQRTEAAKQEIQSASFQPARRGK